MFQQITPSGVVSHSHSCLEWHHQYFLDLIILLYIKQLCFLLARSRNSKLELELAQVRADFERLKSQDNTKSERLEELS